MIGVLDASRVRSRLPSIGDTFLRSIQEPSKPEGRQFESGSWKARHIYLVFSIIWKFAGVRNAFVSFTSLRLYGMRRGQRDAVYHQLPI